MDFLAMPEDGAKSRFLQDARRVAQPFEHPMVVFEEIKVMKKQAPETRACPKKARLWGRYAMLKRGELRVAVEVKDGFVRCWRATRFKSEDEFAEGRSAFWFGTIHCGFARWSYGVCSVVALVRAHQVTVYG